MTPIQSTLRSVRVLHMFFLVSVALYLYLLIWLHPTERPLPIVFVAAIGLVSLCNIGVALFFRSRMIGPSVERLRMSPQDVAALNLWRQGSILSFCFAESVVLFGLVSKFLGAGWSIAGIFFVVGALLLLAWTPKLDLPPGA